MCSVYVCSVCVSIYMCVCVVLYVCESVLVLFISHTLPSREFVCLVLLRPAGHIPHLIHTFNRLFQFFYFSNDLLQ